METIIHSSKPPFEPAEINPIAMPNKANYWLDELCHPLSHRENIKYACLSVAAIALMALPIGVGLLSKHAQGFQFSLANFLAATTASSESPVLAVDASGMTIYGKNISAAVKDRFETAAVEQLAGLHQLYASWTSPHQEAIGSMLLRLFVDASGKVARIEPLKSQLTSGDFANVVLSEMRQWSFPSGAREPVEITIPLLFVPKGMDPSTVVQWERRTRVVNGKEKTLAPTQVARVTPAVAVSAKAAQVEATPVIASPPKVSQDFVTRARVQPSPVQSFPVIKTTQAVALRQQPRFAAERVHEIDAETELSLLENKGDWLKVKVAHAGAIGFVRKEYITPLN
jgi:hypothetical protein